MAGETAPTGSPDNFDNAGGGGGGAGRIRVNSTSALTNNGIISPAETTGSLPTVPIP